MPANPGRRPRVQRTVIPPAWVRLSEPSEWGSRTLPAVFDVPAEELPPVPPEPSWLRTTTLSGTGRRISDTGARLAEREGGFPQLRADNPGLHAYWGDPKFDGIVMAPEAPTQDFYRVVATLEAARAAMEAGEPPVLWEHAQAPDSRALAEAVERQWAAPNGTPLFISGASTRFAPNLEHSYWSR